MSIIDSARLRSWCLYFNRASKCKSITRSKWVPRERFQSTFIFHYQIIESVIAGWSELGWPAPAAYLYVKVAVVHWSTAFVWCPKIRKWMMLNRLPHNVGGSPFIQRQMLTISVRRVLEILIQRKFLQFLTPIKASSVKAEHPSKLRWDKPTSLKRIQNKLISTYLSMRGDTPLSVSS